MLKSEVGGSECSTSENPSKRRKMESGSSSGSPESRNLQPQADLIDTETYDFAVIKDKLGFVDHTLFIRNFLSKNGRKVGIFAPRRFGKSTQLHMLKLFLSCVDKRTGQPYENMNGSVKYRDIYQLFKDTKIITDGNCEDILEKHLGQHPVIHVNFKGPHTILSVKDAKDCVRVAVSDAYREHAYLIDSLKLHRNSKLNADAQLTCENWCSPRKYKNEDLVRGLKNLAEYLYNHFDKTKVYLLVDEFDAINDAAMRNVKGKTVDEKCEKIGIIANVVVSSICDLIKGDDHELIGGALLTGVSYVSGLGYSTMNNLTKLRFLERSSVLPPGEGFVPFYGATEDEVNSLVEKLVRDDKLVNFKEKKNFLNKQQTLDVGKIMLELKSRYNGYLDEEDTPIFCLWSVLQYLMTGKSKRFWNQTDGLAPFSNIFRSKVAENVLELMHGKTVCFQRLDKVEIKQVFALQELINETTRNVNYIVFFNYLMDLGYLSYAEPPEDDQKMNKFKMPNPEVRAAFSEKLLPVLEEWNFDVMSCAKVINELFERYGDQKALQKQMLAIHKELNNNLKKLQDKNPDIVNEARISGALYGTMDQLDKFEFAVDSHIKLGGITVSSGRPDYFLLDVTNKFCILWELKHNRKEKDGNKMKNKTSKYALEEARGNESTTNSVHRKDYMKVIKKRKLDALVIGLSLDGNCETSISYASNDEKKIFCITENEKNLHPDYYSNCIMLLEEESVNDNATE